MNSCLIALYNNNVKIELPFQYFCLLMAKGRTLLIFGTKSDTCSVMAQKILEWMNYEPISFLNVSKHPKEHIEVKHNLFQSLFLRARSLKIDKGVNLFRKITGS